MYIHASTNSHIVKKKTHWRNMCMIYDEETNRKIQNTKSMLLSINQNINDYLNELTDKHVSMYDTDKQVLRKIRDENLETIQLIDKMNYTGVVEL